MADHSTMLLGKRPRRHDPRTLKLVRYMTSALPNPPASVDYTRGVREWGMMLNDQLGDCIIADGPGHATQVWTLNATGAMVTPPDSLILATYEKWCGYNPADPTTDLGGIELDVLNNWRQQGFAGHALDAYVAIELGARDMGHGTRDTGFGTRESGLVVKDSEPLTPNSEFRIQAKNDSGSPNPNPVSPVPCPVPRIPDIATAIWLFGGAYIGVELPVTAQKQDVWDVPANPGPNDEPGSWGGHAVYLVGYDFPVTTPAAGAPPLLNQSSAGPRPACRIPNSGTHDPFLVSRVPLAQPPTLTCLTWGQPKKMTWAWFEKYCSEAYALVSKDWLNASGVSPSGFDLAMLEKDLEEVSGARCQVSG